MIYDLVVNLGKSSQIYLFSKILGWKAWGDCKCVKICWECPQHTMCAGCLNSSFMNALQIQGNWNQREYVLFDRGCQECSELLYIDLIYNCFSGSKHCQLKYSALPRCPSPSKLKLSSVASSLLKNYQLLMCHVLFGRALLKLNLMMMRGLSGLNIILEKALLVMLS